MKFKGVLTLNNIDKTWVPFYKTLASELLNYRHRRGQLIRMIEMIYERGGIKLPTLEKNNELIDIDPFTIFALFNKASMRDVNKIKILNELALYFDIKTQVPTSFYSIPTVNNMSATFYAFDGKRNADDIDNLWALFESALKYAQKQNDDKRINFIEKFNMVIVQPEIGNSKLTSGLYWIAPETFANYDSLTKSYIFETNQIPAQFINKELEPKGKLSGENYLAIIDMLKAFLSSGETAVDNFIDFSHEVWVYSKEKPIVPDPPPKSPPYTKDDLLNDVFMTESNYDRLVRLVKRKKNVILQGPPGVGKTYVAKRLAYSMMGIKDASRVKLIQFHQSYAYEDFIMGYRPTNEGFELSTGAFYDFCKVAEQDLDNDYFFIIDEINRGNLSKIFGELFMLIENDKRGLEVELLYTNKSFSVPENLYIIGMMNTADRSLAILDYALRRRFAFYDMKPAFENEKFKDYQESLNSAEFDALIQCIEALNNDIVQDDMLGESFVIGHSYFSNFENVTTTELSDIIEFEILPLLNEYWFDDPSKVDMWAEKLRNAIEL